MSREYTNELLDMVNDGLLDAEKVLLSLVSYLSEDEVKDFCLNGDYSELWDSEEDE